MGVLNRKYSRSLLELHNSLWNIFYWISYFSNNFLLRTPAPFQQNIPPAQNPRPWWFALKFCVTKSKRSQKYLSFSKNTRRSGDAMLFGKFQTDGCWSFWNFEIKLTGKFPLDRDRQEPGTQEAAPSQGRDTDCNYSDCGCCWGFWPF